MVIEIRNLMFQPLTLHLAGDGGSIHLRSRECKAISEKQVSDEIQAAAARGLVSLSEGSAQRDPRAETAAGEHSTDHPVDDAGPQARQRKRRER